MIIKPKVRGFVCVTAHPTGCAANVAEQIAHVESRGQIPGGPKNVLVVGASTGYGLSSRIATAFGSGAATLGVFFERPASNGRPASAGYYNSVAFQQKAAEAGLWAKSINGDAFSIEIKDRAVDLIRREMGKIDLLVYSLASPRRTDPVSGVTYKSALKPIGGSFLGKTVDTDKAEVFEVGIEEANDEEIDGTIKVMGGEDWELWVHALAKAGLLADGFKTLAYSYIGPEVTWPIYKNGTIGRAKEDLDRAAAAITTSQAAVGAQAAVAVNKAVVTQASSAIPVVPLYVSILFRVMKEMGNHEGCIEQMDRLFRDKVYGSAGLVTDADGRLHVDDYEMEPAVQKAVSEIWPKINTANLRELSDFYGYQKDFLKLFGFGVDGVDYRQEVDAEVTLE